MILLTLGTYPLQFNRLISWIDDIVKEEIIEEKFFAQIGYSNFIPSNMEWIKMLPKEDFDSLLKNATGIISHAGMGNITMAINDNKPLIVIPRLVRYKEHVSDHQLATAKKFEQENYILAAYSKNQLKEKLLMFKNFIPRKRYATPQKVSNRIKEFIRTELRNADLITS